MKLFSKLAPFAAVVLFSTAASAAVVTGEKAPEFTAKTASGKEVKLSDYAGKTVVLEWTNKGCPFVKKFYGSGKMQVLQQKATSADVVWLTVQSSAPGKQGHMSAEETLQHKSEMRANQTAIILDEKGTLGKQYGAKTTPHMFIIDGEGTLVYQGAIDNIASADQKDIANASNYVEVTLAALKSGKPIEEGTTQSYGCGVKY